MQKITVAVHGLGNIGRHVIDCLRVAPDMCCAGVVRREASIGTHTADLKGFPEYSSFEELGTRCGVVDVVILCAPSRSVPEQASEYLAKGVHTVDSFDIHADIPDVVEQLDAVARMNERACITAAGWDPGTDSILRALFEAMAPVGTTFTNFGRGRSMGHSVAARAVKGIADAVSITIPIGGGRHSRLVYVLVEKGASFDDVRKDLAAEPYFSHDPLEVRQVESPEDLMRVADNSHGVFLERVGASGTVSNQRLTFDMRIDNPALTAQVLVSSARAVTRLQSGCHTLIDVPPVAFLPGGRMNNIARLV